MFSEDNILNFCTLCKKCEEVKKCPVKAEPHRRQVSSTFIPLSAIEKMATANPALFKHIEKDILNIRNLSEHLNKLNESIFNGGPGK
jgi:hypothetical protein